MGGGGGGVKSQDGLMRGHGCWDDYTERKLSRERDTSDRQ